ncbi:ATP-dependent DNA helicase [Methanolapillus millepedarum]|uniref:3'-5' exonuclease DinG n=1 Tax=Methanolapillus millepedarum TaxID=3028296 RepID=A0AA96ZUG2_9EURY|nr:3'-5' exonuclease DinG [Methanosarcinaceae archaeon Ac7]
MDCAPVPGFMKYFTKESCYPNQAEAMRQIADALEKGETVLFEGACGTGKTLSALAPALDIAARQNKKVIIVTNVHQQMVQFINEARDIKRQIDINAVVMKGKQAMCPRRMDYEECRAFSENTYELLEMERELQKSKKEFSDATEKYKATKDPEYNRLRAELEKEIQNRESEVQRKRNLSCNHLYEVLKLESPSFKNWLFDDVRSPEEINDYANERGMCGYELLKREIKRADLIICNYHHVLSQEIFLTLLGWLEKLPEDLIIIFDEAHNIENAARSHSSMVISERTVEKAVMEIEDHSDKFPEKLKLDAQKILLCFISAMRETYDLALAFGERNRIGKNWKDIRISDPYERFDVVKDRLMKKIKGYSEEEGRNLNENSVRMILENVSAVGDEIDLIYHERYKSGADIVRKKSSVSLAADYLSAYLLLSENPNYYPILNIRRDQQTKDDEIYGRMELFTCIPKNVTAPLFDSLGGLVLMSATLRPFSMIKETLGIERQCTEIAFPLTFPLENRRTFAVSVPPLFSSRREDPETLTAVENSIVSAILATPGNTLIYFQSFSEAERFFSFLKKQDDIVLENIPILFDEAGISSNSVREKFFKIGEEGGRSVLISYIFGTLSEGVDFQGDRARTVIVVGVGYPALNDRIRAVEAAYDTVFGDGKGWEFAISVPTTRRIRQAMGRVVRSPDDFGVRLLLDARFQKKSVAKLRKYSVYNNFPEEERSEIIDTDPAGLKKELETFFEEKAG